MSNVEIKSRIKALQELESLIEELKGEAETIRSSIKSELAARNTEELITDEYIVRYMTVISNRFDSTSFKKVMPEVYKAYTKQVTSRRFSIS